MKDKEKCCEKYWHIPQTKDHKVGIYNGYCFAPNCSCHHPEATDSEEWKVILNRWLISYKKKEAQSVAILDFVSQKLKEAREDGEYEGKSKAIANCEKIDHLDFIQEERNLLLKKLGEWTKEKRENFSWAKDEGRPDDWFDKGYNRAKADLAQFISKLGK